MMENMKIKISFSKMISAFVMSLFLLSLIAPSLSQASSAIQQTDEKVNVAIVYSTGGLGDRSFNDAAKRGITASMAKYSNLVVQEFEPKSTDVITTQISDYAKNGSYALVIGVGFTATDGVNISALEYTNQSHLLIDAVLDLPNVKSITFKEQEGSFLVGAMAAMVSETSKYGFLGGLDITLINKFLAGYQQGVRYIDSDATFFIDYSPDPQNPWGDVSGGKQIAETFIDEGADVIYAAAGGTGIGVIQAANNSQNAGDSVYAIGVDSDQDHEAEGAVLTSMIKRVDQAVSLTIDEIMNDSFTAGLTELGVKENGVGISGMKFTMEEANATYEVKDGKNVTRWEKVQEIRQLIIDGNISVSATPETASESSYSLVYLFTLMALFVALPVVILRNRKK